MSVNNKYFHPNGKPKSITQYPHGPLTPEMSDNFWNIMSILIPYSLLIVGIGYTIAQAIR